MNEEENNTSGFWLGLLIGGAVGAVAGYLFSNEDKKQALEEIKGKAKLLLENLGEIKDETLEKGEKVKKVIEAEVGEVVKEVKSGQDEIAKEVEGVPQAAKEAIDRVEKAAQEAVKNISESVKSSNTRIDPRKKGFGKSFFKKGNALVKK